MSYAGRSLWAIGATRAQDQYVEERLNLDIGATYAVMDNVSIYMSGRNLLNSAKIKSEGSPNHIIQHQIAGLALFGGVNLEF